jgi:hypothetical protein
MKIENTTEKENINRNNEYIRKAKEYMHMILYGVESFERHGQRPVIVMSQDIFDFLQVFTQNTMKLTNTNAITCCGRPLKIAYGKNILLVALEIRPIWEGE